MKPGIYPNIPFEQYEKIEARNWSTISKMLISPAECKKALDNPREATDAQDFGTAVHSALAEQEAFKSLYVGYTGDRCAGPDYKAFVAANPGKLILNKANMALIEAYQARWKTHPLTQNLLDGAQTELTLVWEKEGILCKGRVDLLTAHGALYDIKTTRCGTPEAFVADAKGFGYIHQLAFYADGLEILMGEPLPKVGFVACSKDKRPTDVLMVFELLRGNELLKYMDEAVRCLTEFEFCMRNNHWPEAALDLPPQSDYFADRPFDLLTGTQP